MNKIIIGLLITAGSVLFLNAESKMKNNTIKVIADSSEMEAVWYPE